MRSRDKYIYLFGAITCLCSVVGTVLIVLGLYGFLWGKDKELKLAAAARAQQEAQEAAQHEQQSSATWTLGH